jgi:hypothetical protein
MLLSGSAPGPKDIITIEMDVSSLMRVSVGRV